MWRTGIGTRGGCAFLSYSTLRGSSDKRYSGEKVGERVAHEKMNLE